MSNDQAKFINSKRRHKNDVAVARQVKIAKAAGMTVRDTNHISLPNVMPWTVVTHDVSCVVIHARHTRID
jgi:hypothetical protein